MPPPPIRSANIDLSDIQYNSYHPRKTKLVATLGPSTTTPEAIEPLVEAGMNVAMISTADFDATAIPEVMGAYASVAMEDNGTPCVILDLADPKIPTSPVYDSANSKVLESVALHKALQVFLTFKKTDASEETLGSLDGETLVLELHLPSPPSGVKAGTKLWLQHGMACL